MDDEQWSTFTVSRAREKNHSAAVPTSSVVNLAATIVFRMSLLLLFCESLCSLERCSRSNALTAPVDISFCRLSLSSAAKFDNLSASLGGTDLYARAALANLFTPVRGSMVFMPGRKPQPRRTIKVAVCSVQQQSGQLQRLGRVLDRR